MKRKSSDEMNSAASLAQEGWVLPPWQLNVLKMHQQPLQLSRTGFRETVSRGFGCSFSIDSLDTS